MPNEEDFERRPKLKMLYQTPEELKTLGTESGFKGHSEDEKGALVTYVNVARVQFEHAKPIRPEDGEGNIVRTHPQYGAWYLWRLHDFDHGHDMVAFFSENTTKNEETDEWEYKDPWVVRDIRNHIREIGLTEDNWKKFLFELGKTKAKGGAQGKWYCRLISTTADTPGLFDDPESSRYKETFALRPEEEAIVKKVNKLVEKDGVPESFTKDMFMTTFISGAAGPPTTESRATTIWTMATTDPERVALHPDLVEFIAKHSE